MKQGQSQQRETKKSQVSSSALPPPPPDGGAGRGEGQVPCTTGPRQPEAEPATAEQGQVSQAWE